MISRTNRWSWVLGLHVEDPWRGSGRMENKSDFSQADFEDHPALSGNRDWDGWFVRSQSPEVQTVKREEHGYPTYVAGD